MPRVLFFVTFLGCLFLISAVNSAPGIPFESSHRPAANSSAPILLAASDEGFFDKLKRVFKGKPKDEPPKRKRWIPMYGMTREENRQIQEMLTSLGYSPGTADGLPGRRTRQAIREYQTAEGLPVDGKPSQELLEHLKAKTQPAPDSAQAEAGTETGDAEAAEGSEAESGAVMVTEAATESDTTDELVKETVPATIPPVIEKPEYEMNEEWIRKRYSQACEGASERAPGIPCPYPEEETCIGEGCLTEGVVRVKLPVVLYTDPGSPRTAYIAKKDEFFIYEQAVSYSVPCPVSVDGSSVPELVSGKSIYRLSDSGEGAYRYLVDGKRVTGAGSERISTKADCVQKDEWWHRLRTDKGIIGWTANEHNMLIGTSIYDAEISQLPDWIAPHVSDESP